MDFLLKQRLIGAIVLVALGVIFIPMLLEGPQQPSVPKMDVIPEPRSLPRDGTLRSFPEAEKKLPLPPISVLPEAEPDTRTTTPEKRRNQTATPAAPPPVAAKQEPVKTASKPSGGVQTTAKNALEPADNKPVLPVRSDANKTEKLSGWVIQAGSFSRQKNAFELRDRLRKAGYATQVERVVINSGTTYRVRVGPYLERSKAEAKIDDLNKKFKLNARVMSYP